MLHVDPLFYDLTFSKRYHVIRLLALQRPTHSVDRDNFETVDGERMEPRDGGDGGVIRRLHHVAVPPRRILALPRHDDGLLDRAVVVVQRRRPR